jgi:tRNA-2-methylthio-N6-dimethylallyladenosine synthase
MTVTKRLFIDTVGCQMNVLDSEMVVASLKKHGYELTREIQLADTILFNTCSVRQHAEDKIYSALGKLKRTKQQHPEKIIGVLGCMAQKDQKLIFDRAPYVDLVVGPGQLHRVPELIEQAQLGARQQMAVSLGRRDGTSEEIRRSHESFDPLRDPAMRPTPFQAYLRIQIGCDKFCTYCVVPMTRGPEQGRPPQQLLQEARVLADQGCLELTLLGQTVNSYRYREDHDAGRLVAVAARGRGHSPHQVCYQLSQGHERPAAGSGARSAQSFTLSACASAKRFGSGAGTDEARLRRAGLPADDGPHPHVPASSHDFQ